MSIKGFRHAYDPEFSQLQKVKKIVYRRETTSARRGDPLTPKQNTSWKLS